MGVDNFLAVVLAGFCVVAFSSDEKSVEVVGGVDDDAECAVVSDPAVGVDGGVAYLSADAVSVMVTVPLDFVGFVHLNLQTMRNITASRAARSRAASRSIVLLCFSCSIWSIFA